MDELRGFMYIVAHSFRVKIALTVVFFHHVAPMILFQSLFFHSSPLKPFCFPFCLSSTAMSMETTTTSETTYPQLVSKVWQYKIVDKAYVDDCKFRKQLTNPVGWTKLGPTASQRCLQAFENPSPYIKHYVTLAPMKAYKLALVQANEIGLCYMRVAHPNEDMRLLARPLQTPLFLNVILTEKEKGQIGVEVLNLAGVTQQESKLFKKRHLLSSVRDWLLKEYRRTNLDENLLYMAVGTTPMTKQFMDLSLGELLAREKHVMGGKPKSTNVKKTHLKKSA